MILFLIINILIIAADILTKQYAVSALPGKDVEIIKNVLYLSYVENKGAAFGIMRNSRIVFIAVTVIVIVGIIIYMIKKKPTFIPLATGLAMICGGGIGNLADRILKGFVVDFIDFRVINFPVFNIADVCVTLGAVLVFISIIFYEDKIK